MKTLTDAELLDAYVTGLDKAAFGELLSRHAALVYRTCLRILKNPHEAEVASKMVFVVLIRKAAGLRKGNLSAWLHRVSYYVASETMRSRVGGTSQDHASAEEEASQANDIAAGNVAEPAARGFMDEALLSLSERFRQAVVLRCLQKHSQEEAAQRAGCRLEVMKRLESEGIARLRARLDKLGVATSDAALTELFGAEASARAPETLPPSILETVRGVVATDALPDELALANAAMKAMSSAKVKRVATVCTVVALLGFAVILLALILPSIRGATGPNLTTGWGLPAGMVAIPGGTNAGIEPGEGPERVEYNLTVKPFWMDEKEVTRELWDEIRIWSNGKGYSYDNTGSAKAVNHPVQKVDWFDCVKWCNARSEKSGFEPVYYTDQVFSTVYRTGSHVPHVKKSANGFRLPTADEWQYAARGGERSHRFPWKDAETIQHVRANYFSMGNPKNKMQPLLSSDTNSTRGFHPKYAVDPKPYTSPVGSFPPNGYGLFDMIGNASEWCFDVAFYPTGRVDRTRRTCCGGGWASVGYSIARSRTFSLPTLFPPEGLPFPSLSESDVGFRTVKEPD